MRLVCCERTAASELLWNYLYQHLHTTTYFFVDLAALRVVAILMKIGHDLRGKVL